MTIWGPLEHAPASDIMQDSHSQPKSTFFLHQMVVILSNMTMKNDCAHSCQEQRYYESCRKDTAACLSANDAFCCKPPSAMGMRIVVVGIDRILVTSAGDFSAILGIIQLSWGKGLYNHVSMTSNQLSHPMWHIFLQCCNKKKEPSSDAVPH